MSWAYPYAKTAQVPVKVSVTELKRRFEAQLVEETGALPGYLPALVKKPLFLEEKQGLSAAEVGTIMHFAMQHLDFRQDDLEAQIEAMVARELLTEQQAQSIAVDKIRRFLEFDLGRRLLAAEHVNREVAFNMELPCRELYQECKTRSTRVRRCCCRELSTATLRNRMALCCWITRRIMWLRAEWK